MNDPLVIGGKEFSSRLMVGTGRHRSNEEMVSSIEASGAQIITVAIRRLDLDNLDGFEQENRRMKSLGFDGCFALTPRQMHKALEVFSYTQEEIEHARRVIEAIETQGSIAKLDGNMIGPPMLKRALKIMANIEEEAREAA